MLRPSQSKRRIMQQQASLMVKMARPYETKKKADWLLNRTTNRSTRRLWLGQQWAYAMNLNSQMRKAALKAAM